MRLPIDVPAHEQEAVYQDLRLPNERVRLRQDVGRARGLARPCAGAKRRRGRRAAAQHLLDSREGRREGVLAARHVARTQRGAARARDRRGRLRRQPGGREHSPPRAICRHGVRPPAPAPPAALVLPAALRPSAPATPSLTLHFLLPPPPSPPPLTPPRAPARPP